MTIRELVDMLTKCSGSERVGVEVHDEYHDTVEMVNVHANDICIENGYVTIIVSIND